MAKTQNNLLSFGVFDIAFLILLTAKLFVTGNNISWAWVLMPLIIKYGFVLLFMIVTGLIVVIAGATGKLTVKKDQE